MPILNLKFKIKNLKLTPAFTLIELLVVISILAVLSGGLLYSTNNVRDKGKDARRKQDLKAISAALISYRADHSNLYPKSSALLNYASDDTDWLTDLSGTYMAKLPHDPANPTTTTAPLPADTNCQSKSFIYCYSVVATQNTFVLWAQLENANDQDLNTSSNAICTLATPALTSFNYCLKSPQ
jgi:prepilin-type N-terminal cleavage/methylation domain-containing protein